MDSFVDSPLLLAYLGDAVMEVMVREHLIGKFADAASCNKAALSFVTAINQANAAKRIRPILSPEEETVFQRAKNAKSHSVPQSADLYSYRLATALEALFGYLYVKGQKERIKDLFEAAFQTED